MLKSLPGQSEEAAGHRASISGHAENAAAVSFRRGRTVGRQRPGMDPERFRRYGIIATNMPLHDRILGQFKASAQTKLAAAEALSPAIERAARLKVHSLAQGGKLLACGNGGSAADAQHFASEMINRFEQERPG